MVDDIKSSNETKIWVDEQIKVLSQDKTQSKYINRACTYLDNLKEAADKEKTVHFLVELVQDDMDKLLEQKKKLQQYMNLEAQGVYFGPSEIKSRSIAVAEVAIELKELEVSITEQNQVVQIFSKVQKQLSPGITEKAKVPSVAVEASVVLPKAVDISRTLWNVGCCAWS